MERECNNCGGSDWSRILEDDYPQRRRERDRTVKTVYVCDSCGAEGRRFEHHNGGTEQYSGALR